MKKLDIKEDIELEEILEIFYKGLDIPEEETSNKINKFFEYMHRLKGFNLLRENVVDNIIMEAFWAGIYFAKMHPEKVTIEEQNDSEEVEESSDVDDELSYRPAEFDENDSMYG